MAPSRRCSRCQAELNDAGLCSACLLRLADEDPTSGILLTGTRLGPYEIGSLLGRGGMGEVYRSTDPRLGRTVAIKVLNSKTMDDADARRRFKHEARAIAALSHPNICAIHDVGHQDGVDFIVLEYLDGETLASRIARESALPIDHTIQIATQVADALTAAHQVGIIHRDLKPGNVMLTKTGAKVLDFGLARLLTADRNLSKTSLETANPLTDAAAIVGTLPYMAPEQIECRPCDARTDLFAFGAVVYEMATGQRPFQGTSSAGIMAAILERTPEPISASDTDIPPAFERLVQKCLAKDPEARWQGASDVAEELRSISGNGATSNTAQPNRDRVRVKPSVAVAVLLLMAAAGAAVWWGWSGQGSAELLVEHRQLTSTGDVTLAVISPDGRTLAYAVEGKEGERRVFVRDLAGGQALPLWTGEVHGVLSLVWHPDGSHVIVGGRHTRMVPRLGGNARDLGDFFSFVAMSPDGRSLAQTTNTRQGFQLVPLSGDPVQNVTLSGFIRVEGLDWHAPTNRIVILTRAENNGGWIIWSIAPDGREQTRLFEDKLPIDAICVSPVADVVYALRYRGDDTRDLLRISMHAGDDRNPDALLTGLPPGAGLSYSGCNVAADGRRLTYIRRRIRANLWRLDLTTRETTQLTRGTQGFGFPHVAPNGQWIAASSTGGLVRIPISGGDALPLGEGVWAQWSPDGGRLAFQSPDPTRILVANADGRQRQEVQDSAGSFNPVWLPDGRLAMRTPDGRNYRIRDLQTDREELLVNDPSISWVSNLSFAPTGDVLTLYQNRRKGDQVVTAALFRLTWPGRQAHKLLDGLVEAIGWSADSEWVYTFPREGRDVTRVSSRSGASEMIGSFPVGSLSESACSLTPDRSAIICSLEESESDAWLMENFDPRIR